jgi:hypothetical protein
VGEPHQPDKLTGARKMKTKDDYYKLLAEIDEIARAHNNAYLTDSCVDQENAAVPHDHPEFWQKMCASLCNSAGSRAEELGLNINKLLNRSIY